MYLCLLNISIHKLLIIKMQSSPIVEIIKRENEMKPKFILIFSAVYLAIVGLGLLLVPTYTFLGLDSGVSPLVIAQLRAMSDTFLGIAVLNWLARKSEASKARDAIFIGNMVGFGFSVVLGANISLVGGEIISWVFTLISLFCVICFILVGIKNMSSAA